MDLREQPETKTQLCHPPENPDRPPRPHVQDNFRGIPDESPHHDFPIRNRPSQYFRRRLALKSNPDTKGNLGAARQQARRPTPVSEQDASDNQTWDKSITPDGLATFLTSDELNRHGLEPAALKSLWSVNIDIDPPVTKASLGELDLVRIMNDPKLRHDLNFEREVAFRPNLYGFRGTQKILHAKEYWEALVVELSVYIVRRYRITEFPAAVISGWLLRPALISNVRWRLPRLFETIREILKTLVPAPEWSAVDQRLDTGLLMQELDHGSCDLTALGEWLGRLLLGSCSPLRDPSVTDMVSKIKQGVELDNAGTLVDGLKSLFGVLETMKLDVANHQLRYLRLLMVDDTVDFEQRYFLRIMSSNLEALDLPRACAWYNGLVADGSVQELNGESKMTIFVKAIIELIVTTEESFPPTFMFDYERLRNLHSDFRSCIYLEICSQVYTCTLHSLGWIGLPSHNCYYGLLKRITSVVGPDVSTHSWARSAGAVALEIVREVYALCHFEGLPEETLLEQTETSLRQSWDIDSAAYGNFEEYLYSDLEFLVEQEIEAVEHLTPLQVLNYLHPGPWELNAEEDNEPLLSIARRIAHVGILHWRVWGPILYEQHHASNFSRTAVGTTTADLPNAAEASLETSVGSLREECPRDIGHVCPRPVDSPEISKQERTGFPTTFFENVSDPSGLAA